MKNLKPGIVLRLPIPDGSAVLKLSYGGLDVPVICSADWVRQARGLSDYIKGLPLPGEANDRLVALMADHIHKTVYAAYASGFESGRQYERGGYDGGPDGQ